MKKNNLCVMSVCLVSFVLAASGHAFADPIFIEPTPYLSSSDSPFSGGSFSYFYLENFEDGLLNTPGVTASAGWSTVIPSAFTDSVDADDGTIDGSGLNGRSFFSQFQNTALTFTFNAAALGGTLPTHVGVVWTDVGENFIGQGIGLRPVTFSATDGAGNPLGSIGPFLLGDGVITGTTAEDRFFGIFNDGGISSITISMNTFNNWEVDHLQYGLQSGVTAVPEPASMILLGTGLIGLVGAARRRRRG